MAGVDRVHRLKVANVGEVDPDAHDVGEGLAGGLQHLLNVAEDLLGLTSHVARHQGAGDGILSHLPAEVEGLPDPDGRRERTRRRREVLRR